MAAVSNRRNGGDSQCRAPPFVVDFVAAGPFSYNHTTGVGEQYDGRVIDKTTGVVESLEGGDFNCGDIVVFFDAITVDARASAGASTIEVVNSYNKFTTSGGAIGFFTINSVTLQTSDPAYSSNGNESVSYIDASTATQTIIHAPITGVEPGEKIILREQVILQCTDAPADVTGNVQTALESAHVTAGGSGTINTGQRRPKHNPGGGHTARHLQQLWMPAQLAAR